MNKSASSLALRGFTLVELLVVLALMSLIMLSMAGALRGMGQTETRIDQRLARMDELRVATGFIRSSLGNISARRADVLSPAGKRAIIFDGQSDAVTWLGVLPARDGAGGRYFFQLLLETVPDLSAGQTSVSNLVLRLQPLGQKVRLPDWGQSEKRVLVENVNSFAIEYEDRRTAPSTWSNAWGADDRLPDAVRIKITTISGAWPDLVVPLRILPFGSSSGNGPTFGGVATQ